MKKSFFLKITDKNGKTLGESVTNKQSPLTDQTGQKRLLQPMYGVDFHSVTYYGKVGERYNIEKRVIKIITSAYEKKKRKKKFGICTYLLSG